MKASIDTAARGRLTDGKLKPAASAAFVLRIRLPHWARGDDAGLAYELRAAEFNFWTVI